MKTDKATSATWAIVDAVTDPVKPMSLGAFEIARLLEGDEAANRLLALSRLASTDERPPK